MNSPFGKTIFITEEMWYSLKEEISRLQYNQSELLKRIIKLDERGVE